jgi:fibronectin-binding autotransporter adhesin
MIRDRLAKLTWLLAIAGPAQAQTTTWTGGAGSSWTNSGNWAAGIPGSGTPLPNSIARFSGTAATTTVTLGGGTSNALEGLQFANSAAAYTLNSGTLSFINNGFIDLLASAGTNTQTINMAVQFAGNGFLTNDVAGATLNLTAVSTTAGGTLFIDTLGTTNITGVVSGGGLNKSGTGTLTLSGVNTYTGVTTISGGILSVSSLANGGNSSNIGAATAAAANLVLDGGVLQYTGATTATNRLFTLTPNGGTLDSGGTGGLTFAGPGAVAFTGSGARTLTLTGTGNTGFLSLDVGNAGASSVGLTKSGSNSWFLTGTNTYSGSTAVQSGTLVINSLSAASANSAYVVDASLLLSPAGAYTIGSLSGSGVLQGKSSGGAGIATLTVGGNNFSTTYSGLLRDASTAGGQLLALTKTGSGTLTLSGSNTYTGETTINGGSIQLDSAGAISSTGTISFGGGTLRFTTNNTTDYSARFSTAAGQQYRLDTNSQTVTLATNLTSTGGSLNKINSGTLVLSGSNEFTGGVTITNGRLQLSNANALGSTGTIAFAGGTMVFSASNTVDYSSRFTSTGTSPYSFDTNNETVTLASDLAGTGKGLTKGGTGTLILTGASSYTGVTSILNGTVSVSTLANGGSNSGIGASTSDAANLVLNNATLRYTGVSSVSTNRAFTLNGSGGTISVTSSATTTLVISGGGVGPGRLTKDGVGILSLTGTNTYTGSSTVSAGTLSIGNGVVTGSVTGNILNNASLQFNNPSTTSFSGDITGTGTLNHLPTGILTLLGTNSYSGATTVTSGTLQIGNGGTTGSITSNITLSASTSNLTFNRSDSVSYAGVVSGSGNLTKTGAGTLTLTGANTYSGTTTISGGRLFVNGTKTGSGNVTAQTGGTLGGEGSVTGAVAFNSGATFDVGDGTTAADIGDIALPTTLSLQGGSTLRIDVRNAITPTAGTTYDQVIVGGLVSLGGMLDVQYDPTGGGAGYNLNTLITFIDAGGLINGTFSNYANGATVPALSGLGGITNWYIDYNPTGGTVSFTPIPEPTGLVAIGAVCVGLGGWVRRRRVRVQPVHA